MFILTKLADLVQIEPKDLDKDPAWNIEKYINHKYANKVIQKIGLCICFYDLLYASDGLIGHGTGLVNVNVEFRLVVFRPFRHEVMTGTISSCNQDGIRIRTTFFDEFWVPKELLPDGSFFSHVDQMFLWHSGNAMLYYDPHEVVRFRVVREHWFDQAPEGPQMAGQVETEQPVEKQSPYIIEAAMEDSGLGPVLWWEGDD